MSALKVLVSWHTDPQYIAPIVISPNQTTVAPKIFQDQALSSCVGWTPLGYYDLYEELERQSLGTSYDLIFVMSDASGTNRPLNVAAFRCPTILCIGDTHHLTSPISSQIDYALKAGFDCHVIAVTRQHLHWFVEAGLREVIWLPGIMARPHNGVLSASRRRKIAFVGQTGQYHPRRRRMLSHLMNNKMPILGETRPVEQSYELYGSSQVSFNCSLNGDLNLRIFEVLASGGCLLTDRLHTESGIDLLLDTDRHYIRYSNEDELLDKCIFLLNDPIYCYNIARRGFDTYSNNLSSEHRIKDLLRWVEDGDIDDLFRVKVDDTTSSTDMLSRRLCVYEELQEIHRKLEKPFVVFDRELPDTYVNDAGDLFRLDIAIVDLDSNFAEPLKSDVVVLREGKTVPPYIVTSVAIDPLSGSRPSN
jgi:hypothetical protein